MYAMKDDTTRMKKNTRAFTWNEAFILMLSPIDVFNAAYLLRYIVLYDTSLCC